MILFGGPKGSSWSDFSGDRFVEFAAGVQGLLDLLGRGLLFRGMVKNGGAILLSEVRTLAIHLCWVVHFPKRIKQLFVADFGRIKRNLNHFGVAGGVGTNVLVRGIFCVAAGITGDRLNDAGDARELASTPQKQPAPNVAISDMGCSLRFLSIHGLRCAGGTSRCATEKSHYEGFLCAAVFALPISASFCCAGAL